MSTHRLLSLKEAAAELGVHRKTVGQIVEARGIKTYPLPYNGNGKGLDASAITELRKALGRPARAKASASA